jgi:hypothetical protein
MKLKTTNLVQAILVGGLLSIYNPGHAVPADTETTQTEHAVTAAEVAGTEPISLDAPDLSDLQHFNEQYLLACKEPKGQEGYKIFDKELKNLNQSTFAEVKTLDEHNKMIRKMTLKLRRQLEKVYVTVINKDIRKQKKNVLKELDKVKADLKKTSEEISNNRKLVDKSQQQIGSIYCKVNSYVDSYNMRADAADNGEMDDVAGYHKSTAEEMAIKRTQLFTILKEFDSYFGYLNDLFAHCEHKVALLDSVQSNIVAFIDGKCRDKSKACIYEMEADLRFQEALLQKLLGDIETAFKRLIQTARNNFFEPINKGANYAQLNENASDSSQ